MYKTLFILPFLTVFTVFNFSLTANPLNIEEPTSDEDTIYSFVEQMPEFPGGIRGMLEYISANQMYPEEAIKDRAEGKIMVRFVVDKEGKVTDPEVRIGQHPALDREALRIIRSMPKWKPGKHEGQTVNVQFILPVEFKLPVEDDEE